MPPKKLLFNNAENSKLSKCHIQEPLKNVVDEGIPRRFWQFRLSVEPTRENLLNALQALRTIHVLIEKDEHPPIKIFLANHKQDLSGWDGTLATEINLDSDRDQRGNEICVYMDYDSQNHKYAFSPEYYKNFMLTLWKTLEKAGVRLNYVTPAADEREVPTESDIVTPIFYSAFKTYDKRHGILFAEHFNEHNFSDPLAGVSITHADLQQFSIKGYHPLEVHVKRCCYQEKHFQNGVAGFKNRYDFYLYRASQQQISYRDFQKELDAINYADKNQVIAVSKKLLETYSKNLPREPGTRLTPFYNSSRIKSLIEQEDVAALRIELETIKKLSYQEITVMIEEYNELQKQLPEIFGEDAQQLKKIILHSPILMQALYSRSVHLYHEKLKIEREKKQLADCFNQWFGAQDRYVELNQLDHHTRKRIIQALIANLPHQSFMKLIYDLSLICYRHKQKDFIRGGAIDFLGDIIFEYVRKYETPVLTAYKIKLRNLGDVAHLTQYKLPIMQLSDNTKAVFGKMYEATKVYQAQQADGFDYVQSLPGSIFIKAIGPHLINSGVEVSHDQQTRQFRGHEKPQWTTLGRDKLGKQNHLSQVTSLFRDYHSKAHWYYLHAGRSHMLQAIHLENFLETAESAEAAYVKIKEYYEQAKDLHLRDPKRWNLNGSYMRRLKYALLICETAIEADETLLGQKCKVIMGERGDSKPYLTEWFKRNSPKKPVAVEGAGVVSRNGL